MSPSVWIAAVTVATLVGGCDGATDREAHFASARPTAPVPLQAAHDWIMEASTVAGQRAGNAEVRRLAGLVRADHVRWDRRIEKFIAQHGEQLLDPQLAREVSRRQWRTPVEFGSPIGPQLDGTFMRALIEVHQDLLAEIDRIDRFASARGELNELLEKSRIIERQHLALAAEVFGGLGVHD